MPARPTTTAPASAFSITIRRHAIRRLDPGPHRSRQPFFSARGSPGITGIFGAHVVAVDAASGAVIAGILGGWSCQAPGPARFDGADTQIGALAVNHSYKIYAEPLNGAVGPAEVSKLSSASAVTPPRPRLAPASILF